MKRLFAVGLFVCISFVVKSQDHYIEWEAALELDGRPNIHDLKKTPDGGFMIVGYAGNYPYDAMVIKTDALGNEEWSHLMGGSDQDIFMESLATADFGYLVVGHSESSDGDLPGNHGTQDDIWVVKFDADGNVVWNRNLGGTSTDEGLGIAQLLSGDYVITGRTFSTNIDFDGESIGGGNGSYFAMKIDDDGNVLDFNTYGNTGIQRQGYVSANPAGGLFISGITTNSGGDVSDFYSGVAASTDIWVVRADEDLNLLSEDNYGGTDFDQTHGIITTADGGYMTYGYTISTDGDLGSSFGGNDIILIKADASGTKEWVRNLGTTTDEYAYSLQQTTDGGYILTGLITSPSGGYGSNDNFLTKISSSGDIEFDYILGTATVDYQSAVVELSTDHYLLTSSSLNGAPSGLKTVTGDLWMVALSPCTDDVRAPDFTTCPSTQTLAAGSTLPDYTAMVAVYDGCDAAPTITQSPLAGSATTDGMTVTMTATDASGNANTCVFVVNLTGDVTDPVITCPVDQPVSCGVALPDYTGMASATDNLDPEPTISQSPIAGSTVVDGMIITLTATDDAGNTDQCTFVVSISSDIEAPVITGLSDQMVDCDQVLPDYTGLGSVSDNCDSAPVVTQSPVAGGVVTDGMLISLTATDDTGNSETYSFNVNFNADADNPTITGLTDQSVACDELLPDFTSLGTVSDNCDASPVVTQTPALGSTVTDGMVVTLRATDASGNFDDFSFNVNIEADNVAPIIADLSDQNVDCGSLLSDYRALGTLTDNCDPAPTVIQSPAIGTTVTDGMVVTLRATDASGNFDDFSFTVNFNADLEAPVMTGLLDQFADCGSSLIDYTSLGVLSDNCDPSPSVSQSPEVGTTVSDGMTITLTASDVSGNSADFHFVVRTHDDTSKPELTGFSDQLVACHEALPDFTSLGIATDDCDPDPEISQQPAVGTTVEPGMIVTISATDKAGNSNEVTFQVFVQEDAEGPNLTCPSEQILTCGGPIPDFVALIAVEDACSGEVTISQSIEPGTIMLADTSVEVMATDEAGNSNVCHVEIVVEDITIDAGNDVTIFEGASTGLSIQSEWEGEIIWSPAYSLDDAHIASPTASPESTTSYTVLLQSEEGCMAEDQVTVWVNEPDFAMGFSPNGDGINDYWTIKDIDKYPENTVYIYNRWGNLIFEQQGYDNHTRVFDGQANRLTKITHGNLPEGTYFFYIKVPEDHILERTEGYLIIKK